VAAWIATSILAIIPNVGPYTPSDLIGSASAIALGTPTDHLATSVLANLALVAALFALSWLAFRPQELASGA
jgi:hypothetical protein